jgi:hypothetical protein
MPPNARLVGSGTEIVAVTLNNPGIVVNGESVLASKNVPPLLGGPAEVGSVASPLTCDVEKSENVSVVIPDPVAVNTNDPIKTWCPPFGDTLAAIPGPPGVSKRVP